MFKFEPLINIAEMTKFTKMLRCGYFGPLAHAIPVLKFIHTLIINLACSVGKKCVMTSWIKTFKTFQLLVNNMACRGLSRTELNEVGLEGFPVGVTLHCSH